MPVHLLRPAAIPSKFLDSNAAASSSPLRRSAPVNRMVNRYYRGPPSDHFDGHRFFNPRHPNTDRTLLELLRWRFGGERATGPYRHPRAR